LITWGSLAASIVDAAGLGEYQADWKAIAHTGSATSHGTRSMAIGIIVEVETVIRPHSVFVLHILCVVLIGTTIVHVGEGGLLS
jgi:hypothetical protein